jgi:hypothetical protein
VGKGVNVTINFIHPIPEKKRTKLKRDRLLPFSFNLVTISFGELTDVMFLPGGRPSHLKAAHHSCGRDRDG